MTLDGVTFSETFAKSVSVEEFIAHHIEYFWLDVEPASREKRLRKVWEMINKPSRRRKATEE